MFVDVGDYICLKLKKNGFNVDDYIKIVGVRDKLVDKVGAFIINSISADSEIGKK